MRKQAADYNAALANGRVKLSDPFEKSGENTLFDDYSVLLCTSSTGIMSYIDIPKIDVFLPVYHGTEANTLENGVGHLEGSSLPIGGESTHCVLSAHTGLNHAKLFTDLTELQNGDLFFLQTLGETLAYEVDQILVVEPYDCSALGVEPGKDYCTLVTCTPYGVNSHRLLVRGKRVPYEEAEISRVETEKEAPVTSQWMREYAHALMAGVILVTVAVLAFLVYGKWGKRE
jgi:sortase A